MISRKSIDQLFFLRFLAAIIVVTHHYGLDTFSDKDFLFQLINDAGFILSFFFVLSGFVIGYNYMDPDSFSPRKYLIRRTARIFPIYLLAFASTLITGMLFFNAYPKGLSIVLQALALHSWIPGIVLEINYPSWSVSVETLFILVFPLVMRYLARMSLRRLVWTAMTVWALSSVQNLLFEKFIYSPDLRWTSEFILYFPLWHMNAFLLGLTGAQLLKHFSHRSLPRMLPAILGLSSLSLILLIAGTDNPIRSHIHNGLLAPLMMLMLIGFSLDRSAISKVASVRPLVYLGNLTYGIYIFQHPVYLWCRLTLFPDGPSGNDFYLYLFMLILFSALTYRTVEVPARRHIIRWADQRWSRTSQG